MLCACGKSLCIITCRYVRANCVTCTLDLNRGCAPASVEESQVSRLPLNQDVKMLPLGTRCSSRCSLKKSLTSVGQVNAVILEVTSRLPRTQLVWEAPVKVWVHGSLIWAASENIACCAYFLCELHPDKEQVFANYTRISQTQMVLSEGLRVI